MTNSFKLTLAAVALSAALGPTPVKALLFDDRGTWESAVLTPVDIDISGITQSYSVPGLPAGTAISMQAGNSLSFDADLYGASAPATWFGSGWSGTPPIYLLATDYSPASPISITGTFNQPVNAFGFEVQPEISTDVLMTLTLSDQSTISHYLNGGAAPGFLGWTEATGVLSFTLTGGTSFAFGNLAEAAFSPAPPEPTNGVPDGGNVTFFAGLLWIGLIGATSILRKREAVVA